jgi:predicted restriction endonuclease
MWSKKYNLTQCNNCGRDSIPHKGFGLCKTCYEKSKGYKWQRKYQDEHRLEANTRQREWAKANPAVVKRANKRWADANPNKTRNYLKLWRKNNKAPFCLICGETRAVDWAHIIPHSKRGPVATWNLFPLCPTHHRIFDTHLLTPEELSIIQSYIDTAHEEFKKQI